MNVIKSITCIQIGRNVLLPLVKKKIMVLEMIKEKHCDNFLECVSVYYLSYLFVCSFSLPGNGDIYTITSQIFIIMCWKL